MIGTVASVDIKVDDATVSARHALLEVTERGVVISDLSSKNGLFVAGARVDRAELPGPVARSVIGRTELRLRRAPSHPDEAVHRVPGLIGDSAAMRRVRAEIHRYAKLSVPVLIQGETGTGKELVARALHELGGRAGAYVPINCASLSEALADSELFGHSKGAFTGAHQHRIGAFTEAHRGTLFLDEIAELAPMVQAKLLRVLEDGEVKAVGGNRRSAVSTRVVAASWRSLAEAARGGRFREDLLHRLATVVIELPPLKNRTGDIPALARALLERIEPEVGKHDLASDAIEALKEYSWPGNVRELRAILYRAALGAEEVELGAREIQRLLPDPACRRHRQMSAVEAERLVARCNGNVSHAARLARVARSTFRSWLEQGSVGGAGQNAPTRETP